MTEYCDLVPMGPRRTVLWVLGLLAVAVGTSALLVTLMVLFLPRALLFGLSAVQVCPMNYIFVWAIGTLVAYRKYRSLRFAGLLAVIGAVLLPTLLLCIFIGVFIVSGPLKVR